MDKVVNETEIHAMMQSIFQCEKIDIRRINKNREHNDVTSY